MRRHALWQSELSQYRVKQRQKENILSRKAGKGSNARKCIPMVKIEKDPFSLIPPAYVHRDPKANRPFSLK